MDWFTPSTKVGSGGLIGLIWPLLSGSVLSLESGSDQ